jgi:hypothetical protein
MPRAPPEERIVGREALCEALRIAEENIASLVDAAQQPDIDPIDARNRDKRRGPSGENERVGGAEIAGRGCAGEPLKRGGDPFQRLGGGVIAGKLWAVFCSRHWEHLGEHLDRVIIRDRGLITPSHEFNARHGQICNNIDSRFLLRHGAGPPLPERLALFLDGVLGVCDGDGKRGRVGGPAGLSFDEPRNNPVELLLQGLEFGSARRKSLVGELDQAIDLAQIAFGFLAIEVSDQQSDRRAGHAQNYAAQIEIFLELIEEALLSTIEIGHDAPDEPARRGSCHRGRALRSDWRAAF